MNTTSDVLAALRQPVPFDLCSKQPRHNKKKWQGQFCTYIIGAGWEALVQLADERAPGWSFEITDPARVVANTVAVTGRLTIRALDDAGNVIEITRSATGSVKIASDGSLQEGGYGDPANNASKAALKRCFRMFGLGSELAAPEIHMRIEKWREGRGGSQVPVYPKYDPAKACSPWLENWRQVPKYVRAILAGQEAQPQAAEEEQPPAADQGDVATQLVPKCGYSFDEPEALQRLGHYTAGAADFDLWIANEPAPGIKKLAGVLRMLQDATLMPGATPEDRRQVLEFAMDHAMPLATANDVRRAVNAWKEITSATGNE